MGEWGASPFLIGTENVAGGRVPPPGQGKSETGTTPARPRALRTNARGASGPSHLGWRRRLPPRTRPRRAQGAPRADRDRAPERLVEVRDQKVGQPEEQWDPHRDQQDNHQSGPPLSPGGAIDRLLHYH